MKYVDKVYVTHFGSKGIYMSTSHGIMTEDSIPCSHCPLLFSSKGTKDNHVKKQHADLFKA